MWPNVLIRDLAEAQGAHVVDVQGAMAAASRSGIIGSDLMLEHVHPNAEGYFRLAAAYFPALVRWAGAPGVDVDDATARREIPLTEVDRLAGEYRMSVLKNDWPFVPKWQATQLPPAANRIEEIAQAWYADKLSWADAMQRALEVYRQQGNTVEAARVAVNLAEGFVTSADAQFAAGRLLLQSGQPQRALRYLARAIALNNDDVVYRLSLAESLFRSATTRGARAQPGRGSPFRVRSRNGDPLPGCARMVSAWRATRRREAASVSKTDTKPRPLPNLAPLGRSRANVWCQALPSRAWARA